MLKALKSYSLSMKTEKWEATGHRLQATGYTRGISPMESRGPPHPPTHVWTTQKFLCPLVYERRKFREKKIYKRP
jgi:hypothetical protein